MDLQEAINHYRACPYTHESLAGVCDDCELNQGFVIEDLGGSGQIRTTICRFLETLDNILATLRDTKGQN